MMTLEKFRNTMYDYERAIAPLIKIRYELENLFPPAYKMTGEGKLECIPDYSKPDWAKDCCHTIDTAIEQIQKQMFKEDTFSSIGSR